MQSLHGYGYGHGACSAANSDVTTRIAFTDTNITDAFVIKIIRKGITHAVCVGGWVGAGKTTVYTFYFIPFLIFYVKYYMLYNHYSINYYIFYNLLKHSIVYR